MVMNLDTARNLLHLGADANATVEKARSYGNGLKAESTLLHLAAWEGRLILILTRFSKQCVTSSI